MGQAIPLRAVKRRHIPAKLFARVLDVAIRAIEDAGIDYVLIGGVGTATLGRRRWTRDIDILVSPADADRALDVLGEAGFITERTNEHWLFKASKDDVIVDIIFWTLGDVYLDEDMLTRARHVEFVGVPVLVASPEDQIVIKVISHDEQSARHWSDALSLVAVCDIDWDYLLERACHCPRRLLSLLVYAESNDLIVPVWVIRKLFTEIYGAETNDRTA